MSTPSNNVPSRLNNGNGNIPGCDASAFLSALMRQVEDRFAFTHGAAISQQLLQNVAEIVKRNMGIIFGLLTTAGLTILLPSLAVAIVNAIGFTSGGVLAGSLAALIQSGIYGGATGGLFSAAQAFGATATIAPPVALAIGGILLVGGVGFFGWRAYKKWWLNRGRGGDDSDDDGTPHADPGNDDDNEQKQLLRRRR